MGDETLTRVLAGLQAHPHDDTPAAIAAQLGDLTRPNVEVALRVLDTRGLVQQAGGHWQPTLRGWRAFRR